MSTFDDFFFFLFEVADDLRLKAKEAKLGAEKVADDLKHKAQEALLKGEKVLNDLKHKSDDSTDESKDSESTTAENVSKKDDTAPKA